MARFFTCDACGHSRDLWLEWAREFVSSGAFAAKKWLTDRWVTCDEAVFRFGIPRFHVTELSGYWADKVPWKYSNDPNQAPWLDAKAFARLPKLREKQNTFVARQLQRRWGLSHVLPTAWDKILAERIA